MKPMGSISIGESTGRPELGLVGGIRAWKIGIDIIYMEPYIASRQTKDYKKRLRGKMQKRPFCHRSALRRSSMETPHRKDLRGRARAK